MALTLIEALNRTRAEEVRVSFDQVAEQLGEAKTEELNYGTIAFRETVKASSRSVIKPQKRVKSSRLGLFNRKELVDALKEKSTAASSKQEKKKEESRPNALPAPDSK